MGVRVLIGYVKNLCLPLIASILFVSSSWATSKSESFSMAESELREKGSIAVIVEYDGKLFSKSKPALLEKLAKAGSGKVRAYSALPYISLNLTEQRLEALRSDPAVKKIYTDQIRKPTLRTTVNTVQANLAHSRKKTGKSVAVAVIDTGVWSPHEMLRDRVAEEGCFSRNRVFEGINFYNNCWFGQASTGPVSASPPCSPCADGLGHGTQVAGIAAGGGSRGLKGVAIQSDIIAINVFSRVTSSQICPRKGIPCLVAFDSDILAGLNYVLSLSDEHDIAAVNLSLGGGAFASACDSSSVFTATVAALKEKNIAVVASSGNSGSNSRIAEPACVSDVIAVGSVGRDNKVSGFSDSNSLVDFLAPGEMITSSGDDYLNDYDTSTGTSFSAPFVTGAIAILRSHNRTLTVSEIKKILIQSGTPIRDSKNGVTKPLIQISDALDIAPSIFPTGSLFILFSEDEEKQLERRNGGGDK